MFRIPHTRALSALEYSQDVKFESVPVGSSRRRLDGHDDSFHAVGVGVLSGDAAAIEHL